MSYADVQECVPIVQSLVDEVEAMRCGKVCLFNWDVSMYRNPQCRIESAVLEMSPEERKHYKMSNENFKGHENWGEDEGGLINTFAGCMCNSIMQSLRYRKNPMNLFLRCLCR